MKQQGRASETKKEARPYPKEHQICNTSYEVMQTYANSKQQRISWASGHTLHHLPRRALKSGQIDTGSPGLQQHPAAKGQEHLPLQKLMDCRWLITG